MSLEGQDIVICRYAQEQRFSYFGQRWLETFRQAIGEIREGIESSARPCLALRCNSFARLPSLVLRGGKGSSQYKVEESGIVSPICEEEAARDEDFGMRPDDVCSDPLGPRCESSLASLILYATEDDCTQFELMMRCRS